MQNAKFKNIEMRISKIKAAEVLSKTAKEWRYLFRHPVRHDLSRCKRLQGNVPWRFFQNDNPSYQEMPESLRMEIEICQQT